MAFSIVGEENLSLLPLNAPFGHVPNELELTPRWERVEGLEGYNEDFDPPLENKLKCSICRKGLREPVQTECGHRFCRKCLEGFMRGSAGASHCPEDGELLSQSKIYSDNFAKREILKLEVFCKARGSGCPWKGSLSLLEDHSKICLHICVECENNCGVQLKRKNLHHHMESECVLRKSLCEHCGSAVSWCELEKHFGSCPKYPQQCDKCKQEGIERDKMKLHLQHHCPNVKTDCPFKDGGCEFEGFRSGVGKHLVEQHLSQITDLMKIFLIYHEEVMQTNAVKGTEVKLEDENKFPSEKQAIWTQWLESEVGDLQKTLHKQRKEIDCLTLQQKETVDRVNELEVEVKLLRQEQQLCNGRYVWKIENIDRCCQDAISGVSPVMYSPGFYASPHGYKLCLRINLNGVKSGVGTHVALYVHMMRGDYDNHLEWPFSKGFSLSIVDQSDDESLQYHITETVITKPELSAFQRPVPPHNVISSEYSGYEHFAPIDKIHKPQYCKNNTLLVKFELTD